MDSTTRDDAGAAGAGGPFVITLASAGLPMMLQMPVVDGFAGLTLFRSRVVEDGRERFRMQLGYFPTRARAEQALARARALYPNAVIARAPDAGLGSLDDTLNTEFRLVRGAVSRLVLPERLPASVPAVMPEHQRYAVHLAWAAEPARPSDVANLAIFRSYTLYALRARRRPEASRHGLRAGFFTEVAGAQAVVERVRERFPDAKVVPVSAREVDMARAAARRPIAPASDGPAHVPATRPGPPPLRERPPMRERPRLRTREELLALLGSSQLSVEQPGRGQGRRAAATGENFARRALRALRGW